MGGARIYSFAASSLYIPQALTEAITQAGISPWMVILAVFGFMIALGMIGAGVMMLLILAPILHPVVTTIGVPYGWTGIWFGVMMVLYLDASGLTPPVGYAVFIMSAMTRIPNEEVCKGCVPYVLVIVAVTWLLTVFPQLVTWLPTTMMQMGR